MRERSIFSDREPFAEFELLAGADDEPKGFLVSVVEDLAEFAGADENVATF